MPRKIISIRYEGEEADIAAAIDALAYYGQYDPTGIATKEEVAQAYLTKFIEARVKSYVPMIAIGPRARDTMLAPATNGAATVLITSCKSGMLVPLSIIYCLKKTVANAIKSC